jgi:hypothetical protein
MEDPYSHFVIVAYGIFFTVLLFALIWHGFHYWKHK